MFTEQQESRFQMDSIQEKQQGKNQKNNQLNQYENYFTFSNQVQNQEITILQIKNTMKELTYQLKSNTKDIMKIKKQLQSRPTQAFMTQALILINSGIQTDPNIIKLLKSKQAKQEDPNQLKNAANILSRRISQISQSVSLLMNYFKNLDKKHVQFQQQIKGIVNEKTISIQQQLDNFKAEQISQKLAMQQKIQHVVYDSSQKIRDFQTKVSWKLQQMKTRLQEKVNEQKFISQLKKLQKQAADRMRDFQIDCNVDPKRIQDIQKKLQENHEKLKRQVTQCEFKIQKINENINQNLVTKEFHRVDRVNIQKRINTLVSNQKDNYERLLKCEQIQQQLIKDVNQLKEKSLYAISQIQNTKKVLKNLKISEEFQQMLSKMNPQQILMLQKRLDLQDFELKSIYKQINSLKRDVDSANSRLKGTGIIIPNMERNKDINKKDIEEAVEAFFVQNRFANKINTIHNQLIQNKVAVDLVKDLNKKLARVQKQSQYDKLLYQMKELQLYVKQEIKLMSEEIKQVEYRSQNANTTFKNTFLQSRSKINSQMLSKKPEFIDKTFFRNTISSQRKSQTKF